MQGLADGYFVLPYTIGNYLAGGRRATLADVDGAAFKEAEADVERQLDKLLGVKRQAHGRRVPPRARQDHVGQLRHGPQQGEPRAGAREDPEAARASSGRTSRSSASATTFNQSLEKAGRVADFLEFGELMCRDALDREESCGGHFRDGAPDGGGRGASATTTKFCHVAVWEYTGEGNAPSAPQGAAGVRERPPRAAELQVMRHAQPDPPRLAAEGARATPGKFVTYEVTDVSSPRSFLEMLDVLNEQLDRARARSRSRSTTTAARASAASCAHDDQRPAARPERAPPPASCTCASFKDGDEIYDRAVARRGLPGRQGPRRRPQRVRPHRSQAGGFITRQRGWRRDANAILDPEGGRRPRDGRRRVHRLRRLRGRVPERLGDAVHRREGRPPRTSSRRASPSATRRVVNMVERDGRGRLRRLHEPRRVRGRLPEGDPARLMAEMNRDYGKAAFIHRDRDENSDGGA